MQRASARSGCYPHKAHVHSNRFECTCTCTCADPTLADSLACSLGALAWPGPQNSQRQIASSRIRMHTRIRMYGHICDAPPPGAAIASSHMHTRIPIRMYGHVCDAPQSLHWAVTRGPEPPLGSYAWSRASTGQLRVARGCLRVGRVRCTCRCTCTCRCKCTCRCTCADVLVRVYVWRLTAPRSRLSQARASAERWAAVLAAADIAP